MDKPTYENTRKNIEDYYNISNFPKKQEYIYINILKFSKYELKTLLKALKAYYIQYLNGRERTKKGYD